MLELGGAIDVSDTHELKAVLSNLIEDKASLAVASKICFDYVNNNSYVDYSFPISVYPSSLNTIYTFCPALRFSGIGTWSFPSLNSNISK